MKKKGRIVSYSTDELQAMQARGESQTDWARVNAMTSEEIERLADEDDAENGIEPGDWSKAFVGLPPFLDDLLGRKKDDIHIRVDSDVLKWFKRGGRGYQTRINSVLRAFVRMQKTQKAKPRASKQRAQ